MSKILIDEATVTLALEGIESMTSWEHPDDPAHPWTDCAKLLREALAEQPAQQEHVTWINEANLNSAAIQRNRGGQGDTHTWSETPTWDHSVPLYTSPPAQRILELEALLERQTALLERQTARIVDLQTHIDNFDGEDR